MNGFVFVSENIGVDRVGRRIYLSKTMLLVEDRIAVRFATVLESVGVGYGIVAGYVAILFGRSRRSDDIDFIAEDVGEEAFIGLCKHLRNAGFGLMQGDISSEDSLRRVYRDYLRQGYGVRFMYKDVILPNIEFKLASTEYHTYSIKQAYEVILNNRFKLRIAPMELQIAYKLYLGSSKDVGDAVFLYELFKPVINHEKLKEWCRKLGVDAGILTKR